MLATHFNSWGKVFHSLGAATANAAYLALPRKETLILHLLHQQHCHLLTLLYSARYRCTTESASFATLTVLSPTARDGFPHRRPPPKSKGSFQSFPLYPNTTHWICMMVVIFLNQCNSNKNINFVCHQSHFKIISAIVFTVVLQTML